MNSPDPLIVADAVRRESRRFDEEPAAHTAFSLFDALVRDPNIAPEFRRVFAHQTASTHHEPEAVVEGQTGEQQ